MKRILIVLFLLIHICSSTANPIQVAVYVLRDDNITKLLNNIAQLQNPTLETIIKNIHIIVPQAYQVDENGLFWGHVEPQSLEFAKKNHMQIMPLVTNIQFNQDKVHGFLNNPIAQDRAIRSMLEACETYHYDGLQIDFEHMNYKDRQAYSNFFIKLADLLHKNGFKISVTIFPSTSNLPPATEILKSRYEHWRGVYDYQILGKYSDFVMLMAYDQHGGTTAPGAVANVPWLEDIIKYALQYIPPQKISLGVAVISLYWKPTLNHSIQSIGTEISHSEAVDLIKKAQAQLIWNDRDKVFFTFYTNNELNDYIFLEEQNSFRAKLALVKKYQLLGISIWRLGQEDPQIWNILQEQNALF